MATAQKTPKGSSTEKQAGDYINNPFWIVIEGANLLFKNASTFSILLIIFTAFLASTSYSNGSETDELTSSTALATFGSPVLDTFAIVLFVAIGLGVMFGLLVIGSFMSGVMSYTAVEVSKGNTVTLKQAARATLNRLWSYVWLQVLTIAKVLLWSLLLVVPGIIMAVRYSLANLSFFDSDKNYTANAALQNSVEMTKGAWVTTFGAQMFFNIITLGLISPVVEVASKSVLYRQLNAIKRPEQSVPAPHPLSQVTLSVLIIIAVIVVTLFGYAVFNLAAMTTL